MTSDLAVSGLLFGYSHTQPLFCTLRVRALNYTGRPLRGPGIIGIKV